MRRANQGVYTMAFSRRRNPNDASLVPNRHGPKPDTPNMSYRGSLRWHVNSRASVGQSESLRCSGGVDRTVDADDTRVHLAVHAMEAGCIQPRPRETMADTEWGGILLARAKFCKASYRSDKAKVGSRYLARWVLEKGAASHARRSVCGSRKAEGVIQW
ncbi:uncharacterized protein N7459_005016 [Penicillium hispanicum]|uniref:uncharacterized protein n=1 Tax=Penicillium hispanicum TaxID=1080232 RepID=UPI002541DDBA|nr:uncharacterized protein N7459_005016 [Penicillium hispanicum]KAJ5585216.1 hypothetical protein N7459_005016 [Penicillium hispanicum]